MYLRDYIREYGPNLEEVFQQLADKFSTTPRSVQAWYYGQRYPNVENARIIVRKTAGAVDYEGIYAPYEGQT